jgi:radical SAM superfamily enzyme YgiQ (UPF0313 family)
MGLNEAEWESVNHINLAQEIKKRNNKPSGSWATVNFLRRTPVHEFIHMHNDAEYKLPCSYWQYNEALLSSGQVC